MSNSKPVSREVSLPVEFTWRNAESVYTHKVEEPIAQTSDVVHTLKPSEQSSSQYANNTQNLFTVFAASLQDFKLPPLSHVSHNNSHAYRDTQNSQVFSSLKQSLVSERSDLQVMVPVMQQPHLTVTDQRNLAMI